MDDVQERLRYTEWELEMLSIIAENVTINGMSWMEIRERLRRIAPNV